MANRKIVFDNGTYVDGKKRIVYLIDSTKDEVVCCQNPYKGKMKNNKSHIRW